MSRQFVRKHGLFHQLLPTDKSRLCGFFRFVIQDRQTTGEIMPIRTVFVQNVWREYFGVMTLSAVLKRAGHDTRLVIDASPARAATHALNLAPDLIAFSFTNCERAFALACAREVKRRAPGVVTVAGGPDPTLNPDLASLPELDVVCRGEGEGALLDLADSIDQGRGVRPAPNLWTNQGGQPVRPLFDDLDALPLPDRALYYRHPFLRSNPVKFFMTGRGCPFSCTFCFNRSFRRLYENDPRYVRHHSPQRVVEEILDVKVMYGLRTVRFEDDVFTLDRSWLSDFLARYRNRVRLPFLCYLRADVDESTIAVLKASGCRGVLFGIETGDEQRRNRLLHKGIRNDQIQRTARRLHDYRLAFFTTNMLGLPGETWSGALKTLRLNQRIGSRDVWCSIFQPYAGLPLTETAIRQGMLEPSDAGSVGVNTFDASRLRLAQGNRIANLHKLFYPLARWPWLEPVLLPLTRLPRTRILHYVFVFFYVVSYRQHSGVGLGRLITEGMHWFGLFRAGRNRQRTTQSALMQPPDHGTAT